MPTAFSLNSFYTNQTILPTTNIAHQPQSKTQLSTSFTRAYEYLIECLGRVLTVAATATRDAMKCQWLPGFPFVTHPHQVRFSINSALMFGFSCAVGLNKRIPVFAQPLIASVMGYVDYVLGHVSSEAQEPGCPLVTKAMSSVNHLKHPLHSTEVLLQTTYLVL
ncbi:hypothetical protein M8C21_016905 [Ambrosia artemisiifolia]|uniref:Uncharacterized protein n=1 Tax=Ambrosia artemisiifolia TaxID=4212 RepID=A0AAD5CQ33_AMBAR|nr:hypothetical protein M8C21_016905 [Ambrosia artemisiifolia]